MSAIWTPNSKQGALGMLGLVLPCAQCQQSVSPEEFVAKEGLCIRCTCDRRCADLRAELVRLYRKREKLLKVGASTKSNDEQADRVRKRIVKYVSRLTPSGKLIQEVVNRQGQLAREAALANSRIRLLPFGR